ncbi:MAG: hypothetical protein FWF76_05795 [Oscillospiraceae bacterium]|nr:hypothetical protein [Oscillospiraceae bacterium]
MSNKTALIVTIIVAVLAVGAVGFTIFVLGNGGGVQNLGGNDLEGVFIPDEDLVAELESVVEQLVYNNAEVFRLFNTKAFEDTHFEHEPYGNEPEDGFRTLRQEVIPNFETVDEIFALVDATFAQEYASIIKNDDTRTGGEGPVYTERVAQPDRIGVNIYFDPLDDSRVWGAVEIDLEYESENEALLILTPAGGDESQSKHSRIIRESDGWRLENLIQIYS